MVGGRGLSIAVALGLAACKVAPVGGAEAGETATSTTDAAGESSTQGESSGTETEGDTDTETGETGEAPSGDLCPEEPQIGDWELRFDGQQGTQDLDVDEGCDVAGVSGGSLGEGLVVNLDCVGGSHTLELLVEVEGAPASLPFAFGDEVQLRAWGRLSWFSSVNVWIRDLEGAVLLAYYSGEYLPDDVPGSFADEYAPPEVSEGLYLWVDEDFSCPLECPEGDFVPQCECHQELALGVRFPGFEEAIVEAESAGPVPNDPSGWAAVERAHLYEYPDCSVADAPEQWFELLVLGG